MFGIAIILLVMFAKFLLNFMNIGSSQSRADLLALGLAVTNILNGLVWLSIRPKTISVVRRIFIMFLIRSFSQLVFDYQLWFAVEENAFIFYVLTSGRSGWGGMSKDLSWPSRICYLRVTLVGEDKQYYFLVRLYQ